MFIKPEDWTNSNLEDPWKKVSFTVLTLQYNTLGWDNKLNYWIMNKALRVFGHFKKYGSSYLKIGINASEVLSDIECLKQHNLG